MNQSNSSLLVVTLDLPNGFTAGRLLPRNAENVPPDSDALELISDLTEKGIHATVDLFPCHAPVPVPSDHT